MGPFTDIAAREKIKILLDKMVSILLSKQYEDLPGLLLGNSGIILFLAYYSKHIQEDEAIYNRIGALIHKVVAQCNSFPVPSFFGTGLSGIGWCFQQLMQIGLLDNELQPVIDEMAYTTGTDMMANLEAGNLDLMYGFMGQYLFMSGCGLIDDSTREQVQHFFARNSLVNDFKASFADDGRTINLGLAHGLPGLGLFLLHHNLGDDLLDDIVKQISALATARSLQQGEDQQDYFSLFPNSAALDALPGSLFQNSRYAWCYGDLGILYLLAALKQKGYQDPQLDKTIALLLPACNERNLNNAAVTYIKENGCYDIGFCHGLSGIFYLQGKINALLPSSTPLYTTAYWLDQFLRNLTLFLEREPFGKQEGPGESDDPLSLLEGLPGAGLVLISYLTGDTSWDRCFLLS